MMRLHCCDYVSQQVDGTNVDKRVQNPVSFNVTIPHCQPVAQDTSVLDMFSGKESVASGFSAALKIETIKLSGSPG